VPLWQPFPIDQNSLGAVASAIGRPELAAPVNPSDASFADSTPAAPSAPQDRRFAPSLGEYGITEEDPTAANLWKLPPGSTIKAMHDILVFFGELGISKYLSPRQNLHISPVSDGRSVLTANPSNLLQGLHDGAFKILRQPRPGQVVVDFGKPIGEYWRKGVRMNETQFGSVLFGKKGAHIVPANPNQW
jgi:hypothetical protein